jgi:hypothetical protein
VSSARSTGTAWQQAAQTQDAREQIREQVRRDVEQALRQARQAQPNLDEATRAAVEGAAAAARAQAEAAAAVGPPPPPPPPGLPEGLGVLRGRDGQVVISTGTGHPMRFPGNEVPPQVVDISIAFFIMIATVFIGTPLARAFARRMDRQVAPAAGGPEVVTRLDRIEQAVDAIALEVERISEGQRFVTRMMAEPRAIPSPNEAAESEMRLMERGLAERAAAERGT